MTTWIDVGCTGGDCPRKERCRRFVGREDRDVRYTTPPYHKGIEGNPCNYYEHYKEED